MSVLIGILITFLVVVLILWLVQRLPVEHQAKALFTFSQLQLDLSLMGDIFDLGNEMTGRTLLVSNQPNGEPHQNDVTRTVKIALVHAVMGDHAIDELP